MTPKVKCDLEKVNLIDQSSGVMNVVKETITALEKRRKNIFSDGLIIPFSIVFTFGEFFNFKAKSNSIKYHCHCKYFCSRLALGTEFKDTTDS